PCEARNEVGIRPDRLKTWRTHSFVSVSALLPTLVHPIISEQSRATAIFFTTENKRLAPVLRAWTARRTGPKRYDGVDIQPPCRREPRETANHHQRRGRVEDALPQSRSLQHPCDSRGIQDRGAKRNYAADRRYQADRHRARSGRQH